MGPPVNLGPIINTSSNESVPAFSRDGHLLFFSSNRPLGFGKPISGSPGAKTRTTTSLGNRRRIWEQGLTLRRSMPAPVTSKMMRWAYHNSTSTVIGLAVLGLLTSTSASKRLTARSARHPWSRIERLAETSRSSIRHDGREIFFNSNRPGSVNTFDLWVATRETVFDAWSEPINLGPTLNSGQLNVHPYISSDRETLFFASIRPEGFGQTDLYMSTRTKLSRNSERWDTGRSKRSGARSE